MDKTYRPLTIPKLVWDKKTLTQTYGELVAQPLEPGFGITLGNALRRILLGGIEGSAVTSFIVKGINNEFKAIPGMLEDALQLSLNLKGIIVKNYTGLAGTLKVVKKVQVWSLLLIYGRMSILNLSIKTMFWERLQMMVNVT